MVEVKCSFSLLQLGSVFNSFKIHNMCLSELGVLSHSLTEQCVPKRRPSYLQKAQRQEDFDLYCGSYLLLRVLQRLRQHQIIVLLMGYVLMLATKLRGCREKRYGGL